jgi:hypothetical protein
LSAEQERRVVAFCSDCHALPRAESFSRDRWHQEAKKGYEFYARSGRMDLDPPPLAHALAYFRDRAPEELAYPAAAEAAGPPPVKFTQEHLSLESAPGILPEIAYLRWVQLQPGQRPVLVACDMRYGHVVALDLRREKRAPPRLVSLLRNPCRIEPCDLDADGTLELVVADLGSFLPAEHERGRVVLLRRLPDTRYDAVELATGLGRVADVRAADFSADGRLDLVVAEFGWRRSGRIFWLENQTTAEDGLKFELHPIDDRPGTIHVPVHDFDGDGSPDFAALVSQEFESVDLFLNRPGGRFVRRNVWAGPDLTFGSSGLELVDLDGDRDQDVLVTNGDAFDNTYVSPGHGVQWLENRGGLDFAYHRLTELPGAYRALAADFDGDGDQDVLAVSWLPRKAEPATLRAGRLASIVLLEQTATGKFERHTLEWDAPIYATLAVADFDADGDTDFAVGSGPNVAEGRTEKHFLTVWWNEAR